MWCTFFIILESYFKLQINTTHAVQGNGTCNMLGPSIPKHNFHRASLNDEHKTSIAWIAPGGFARQLELPGVFHSPS